MPFALIFLKASQFNQMGYFSGLMTFTFLQLMPVDFSGFLVQTAAMLWGLCIFIILVLLFQVRFPKTPGYQTRQKGLLLIGSWLKSRRKDRVMQEEPVQKRGRKHRRRNSTVWNRSCTLKPIRKEKRKKSLPGKGKSVICLP